jgi:SAM-dependent methyltransferase
MAQVMQREVWESLGAQDPDWAVESTPGKKHGGWKTDLETFYRIGRERIKEAIGRLPEDAMRHAALDFGSGTGRLAFALAEIYDRVTALDISTPMLKTLMERAKSRGINNITAGQVANFRPTADHDYAISLITLQHFPARAPIAEAIGIMLAAVKPGGHVYIELPLRPHTLKARIQPRLQLYRLLRYIGFNPESLHARGLSGISMLCAPREWVTAVIESHGAKVLNVFEHVGTTHQAAFYLAVKD